MRGQGGLDTLDGGTGVDRVDGVASNNVLRVELDSDLTVTGSNGNIEIAGGDGDRIEGTFARAILVGGPSNNVLDASGFAGRVTLIGNDGDDTLIGSNDRDLLVGGAGNDTLQGLGSHDTLLGGTGRDSIQGGSGQDTLLGGADSDTLRGESGRDSLLGEGGSDLLDGGSLIDRVAGGGNGEPVSPGDNVSDENDIIDETMTFAFGSILDALQ